MRPTKDQQRELVQCWDRAGRELSRLRRENLRGLPYRWEDVNALLELGDSYDGPPRLTSGLVEMQRWFMQATRKKGLSPMAVNEPAAQYGTDQNDQNTNGRRAATDKTNND